MSANDRSRFIVDTLIIVCSSLLIFDFGILRCLASNQVQCNRKECHEQAARLLKSIDSTIDPCDDFVEFACGKAFASFQSLSNASPIDDVDSRSMMNNRYRVTPTSHNNHLRWLRRMLEKELDEPHRIEDPRSIGLAKMYWQSCKITSAKEALDGVRILFKRLGGWPLIMENWQDKHFTWDKFGKCSRLLGFLPRMFVHVGLNEDDIEKPWYSNDTIELTIERSKYMQTPEDMEKAMERVAEYEKIAEYLAVGREIDIVEIEEALHFGKQIHRLTHSEDMPIIEQKVMTIDKLQQTYPFVNWMDYIRSMLTRRQANYLSDRNCVVADVCYLSQIGNLLERTSKRVQANYAFLSIIDDLFLFIRPQLSLTFAQSQREIEEICFDSVIAIFRKAIEMMVAKLAGQEMRLRMNDLQRDIADRAHRIFHRIPWMDHQTQLQAAKKSEKTTFVNLFEDDIFDDRYFDRLEFTQPNATLVLFREANVFLVDRYYLQLGRPRNCYILHRGDNQTYYAIFKSPFSAAETAVRPDRISNQVYVPAGVTLDGKFSVHRELDFMNYATIGLQIANAMGHQIYQRGSFIDSNKQWREASWWSKTTQGQFASRENCLKIGNVKPLEDMSPVFGYIGAAEIAYESMFDNPSHVCNVILPGLNYTTKQLFWITAVASDCDKNLKRRYNAMIAHNCYFPVDFNCPKESPMNVENKCKMWVE